MEYNISETHKKTLRWIVNEVKNGKLEEERIKIGWNSDGTYIMGNSRNQITDFYGEKPDIKEITLDLLHSKGFLFCRTKGSGTYECTILPKGKKAVESNFQ